jgi:methionyl aminopeptidase
MIKIKTPEEIKIMQQGGKILAVAIKKVVENIKPGVSELDLEKIATEEITRHGAEPAFKRVRGYDYALCISTNDVIVHGIPGKYKFKLGDVVGIDCGVYYKGFNTDTSETLRVSANNEKLITNNEDEIGRFLEIGRRALFEAINEAIVGNRVGNISKKIQDIVEGEGYSIVKTLVGHGVGKDLHEEPEIPGFLDRKIDNTPLLKEGMTLAIEVIYNMGKAGTVLAGDNWTIKTKDGSLSGLFERTIAVTKDGPVILT